MKFEVNRNRNAQPVETAQKSAPKQGSGAIARTFARVGGIGLATAATLAIAGCGSDTNKDVMDGSVPDVGAKKDTGSTSADAGPTCKTRSEKDAVQVLVTNVKINGESCKVATGCEAIMTVDDTVSFGTKSPKTGTVSSISAKTVSITMDNDGGTVNVNSAAGTGESGCKLEVSGSDPEACASALKGDIEYTPNTPVKNDVSIGVRATIVATDKLTGKTQTVLLEQGTAAATFQVGESVVSGLTAVDGTEGKVILKATVTNKYGTETVLGGKSVSAKGSTTVGVSSDYVTLTAAGVSDSDPFCAGSEAFAFNVGKTGEALETNRVSDGGKLVAEDSTVVLTVKVQASLTSGGKVDTTKPYYAAVLQDGEQMAVLAKGETATISGLDVEFVGAQ